VRRASFSALVAAALLSVVAACGTGHAPQVEPPIHAGLRVPDIKTFLLPLDAYRLNQQQYLEFTRARLILVQGCMGRFGIDYPLPPLLPEFHGPNEKRYGLADPHRAATVGYHDPEADERSRAIGAVQDMTPKQEVILNGLSSTIDGRTVPAGGCNGESLAKLDADPEAGLVETLSHDAYARSLADSRVVRVVADWSACMRAAGEDYADPLAAGDDVRFATAAATRAEIVVASLDVACKIQVNYVNVRAAVETAYQLRAIAMNQTALDTVKARNETIMQRVAQVNAA
jgi:hypothetical protein